MVGTLKLPQGHGPLTGQRPASLAGHVGSPDRTNPLLRPSGRVNRRASARKLSGRPRSPSLVSVMAI